MVTEEVILVDERNVPIGTAPKLEVHTAETPLHRAFSIFLFNDRKELLLQRRSRYKKTWPLVWSNSCCGHPQPGEETEAAAHRRMRQELGIEGIALQNVLPNFRYRAELDGIVENEICPVFVGHIQENPVINPQEIEAIRWIDWEQFLQESREPDCQYSPWSILEAHELSQDYTFQVLLDNM